MKKIILIFSVFIIGNSFVSVNPTKNKFEKIQKSIISLNEKNDEFGCRVSCYATATNTETGQSQTFYARATGELCGVASLMCQTSAMRQALTYIES
ncbi:hypothetical protein SAMN05428642_101909 [Flaviramulus basaltis]|uniref:Uncharacterized protein n=1 Tax=Flaviramulus basaltis TaxID=369401 RepID=A0A1K2IDQ0_9FLAO|nr:hypothetical protein [Flaviramulus basaltis]SFZ90390.1 hypothetical protein SAMN05428642_101909 [Flaviramulus basaltis]